MAATVTKQTILDGSRLLIVNIHIDGDAAGDLAAYVLVDASAYSPAFTNCRIRAIHSNLNGFTAELLWDATTDVHAISLADYEATYGYEDLIGRTDGIPNSGGAGRTGDILLTTTGLAAGDHGTIQLEIVKTELA